MNSYSLFCYILQTENKGMFNYNPVFQTRWSILKDTCGSTV